MSAPPAELPVDHSTFRRMVAMDNSTFRAVALATFVTLLPLASVHAQVTSSFTELRLHTRPGDALQVRHMDGRRTTGDLRVASVGDLLLDVDGQLVTIPVADIRELGTTGDRLRNGALIGLATGGVLGMILTSVSSTTSGDGLVDAAVAGEVAMVGLIGGAGVGVAIGISIDALVRRYRVLYEAPIQLAPIAVKGLGHGLAFRMSW